MSVAPRKAISQRVRFAVFRRDNFICRYCGRSSPDVELHIEHIKPVSDGGGDEITNLVSACVDCNQGKSNKRGICPPTIPADAASGNDSLVGFWLIELNDKGHCQYAMKIVKRINESIYVVEFINWIMGALQGDCKTVTIEQIVSSSFVLFDCEAAMWHAFEYRYSSPEWREYQERRRA